MSQLPIDGQKLLELLEDEVNRVREEQQESRKIAPNSYGAVYDFGFLVGLRRAITILKGDEE
jgi:hypothetical protein